MDIYRTIGLLLGAMFIPLIMLIIYKAVPKFRRSNPKVWYIIALIIAEAINFQSFAPILEKMLVSIACLVFFLLAMFRDIKMRQQEEMSLNIQDKEQS